MLSKSTKLNIQKPSGKLIIGSIGRLVEQKGYDRLLQVVNRLRNDGLQIEVWIFGEGEERSKLEQYISSHQLADIVRLMGFHSNPYPYIAKCDLFVCSSRAEGFNLAIAEAMVLGLPVISTDCAGPNELLGFGEFGMLVPNNEEDLYIGTKALLTDEGRRTYYRGKSLERRAMFNIHKAVQAVEQLF